METTTKLLTWSTENIGPLEEIQAINGTVRVRLKDGRSGFLIMGFDGVPVANLPPEVGI